MRASNIRTVLGHGEFLGACYFKRSAADFSLAHWIVDERTTTIQPHGHHNAHFGLVTAGRCVTRAIGSLNCDLPTIIYNPAQTFHSDRFEGQGSFFTVSISSTLNSMGSELSLPNESTRIAHYCSFAVLGRIMRECAEWDSDSAFAVEALCAELVGSIGKLPIENRMPKWLKTASAMLRDCYAEEINMKDLSHAVGVHPVHLTRSFRRFFRCTPSDFVRIYRTAKAAELLTSTRCPIAQVAAQAGFYDQSHFTKLFRRIYGLSPREYRRLTTG